MSHSGRSQSVEREAGADTRHPLVVEQHDRLERQRDEIFALGLERNVVELELFGYTVLEAVRPPTFFEELREKILELGREDEELGRTIKLAGPDGASFLVREMLARGRIFEEAVMAEKPLALVTYLMGESCQLSAVNGHVRAQGDVPQAMHVDTPFIPAPLPDWTHTCNVMWCMDDFDRESGGTLVVPGSHKTCSHPLTGRTSRKMAIPVEAPKGSVFVFSGNLWHGAGARTKPGVRVGMTVYFSRMYARPQEPINELVSDEIVARNPPRFAELVGRHNPYPYPLGAYGKQGPRTVEFLNKTKDPRG